MRRCHYYLRPSTSHFGLQGFRYRERLNEMQRYIQFGDLLHPLSIEMEDFDLN